LESISEHALSRVSCFNGRCSVLEFPLVQDGVGGGINAALWLRNFEADRAAGRYPDLMDPVDIAEEAFGEAAQIQPAEAKPALSQIA
jgi:hypothetical protein